MSETICRAIVKGRLFSNVETRNMFDWHSVDGGTPSGFAAYISNRLGTMFGDISNVLAGAVWQAYAFETEHWDGESWVPDYSTSWAMTPTGIGSTPQYQTAVLVSMLTNHKRTVGRKFIAGFLDSVILDGGLSSTALTAFANFIISWLLPMVDDDSKTWYAGVMDKTHTFRAFNGGTVGQILSTWRKRKPGYGI